jgi:hypothetical protein
MRKEPIKVSLIGKGKNNVYHIKFSHLEVPIHINEELYQRMLTSAEYQFINSDEVQTNTLSASMA